MVEAFFYVHSSAEIPREGYSGRPEDPIGIFDSGAGGLTILSALRKELPYENYIYFGDTAHCPYGMRSEAEIIELSIQASQFLLEQGAKLIVVACNTASLIALNALRATFPANFIGVVPAVKPAVQATRKGRIGIAATDRAIKTTYLHCLIEEFSEGIQVYTVGCPELVALVEQGELEGPLTEQIVRNSLQPLISKDVDVIVLGCTHFPALRPVIERVSGSHVQIIDSTLAVARHTRLVLQSEAMLHHGNLEGTAFGNLEVFCSGDTDAFSRVASQVLNYPIMAYQAQYQRAPSVANWD